MRVVDGTPSPTPQRWTAAEAAARSVEVLRAYGARTLASGVLAEVGYRRLLLLGRSLEGAMPSPATGLKVEPALLTPSEAEEYAAFRPETDPLEVRRRLDGGHLCVVARLPRQGIVTASWIGTGSCPVPYLGCVLELAHDEVYSYDWLTERSVRGMGAARARLAWELRLMQARGASRALTALLPENSSARSVAYSAGFGRRGVLRSVWLGGRRRSWQSTGARNGGPRDASALVRRGEWGALAPREDFVPRGPLRGFVLHHTAAPEPALDAGGREAEVDYMRRIEDLHLSRGWAAIGYHFVIMPSGRIFEGRPSDVLGAHVLGHNTGTVGVALAGKFDQQQPTQAALAAIDRVRWELVPGTQSVPLVAHRDLADTTCPGDLLYRACAGALGGALPDTRWQDHLSDHLRRSARRIRRQSRPTRGFNHRGITRRR